MGPLDHVAFVGACLDELDARWVLGGSLASSLLGEPRSTNDVDIAVELAPDDVVAFVETLGGAYYASIAMLTKAATSFGSCNLLHHDTGFKVDLFFLGHSVLDRLQIERRERVELPGREEPVWVTSVHDVVLRKLWWFRLGGGVSDRQWADVASVLRVQAGRIDRDLLLRDAARCGLSDLVERALDESS